MAPRHLALIAALTLPAILAPGPVRQAQPAVSYARLRIDALIPGHLQVRLTSAPPGLFLDSATTDDVRKDVDVLTPAVVLVADSVRVLRIVTYGPRAVRLQFDSAHTAPDQRVPTWGRDITLVRRPNGYLQPVVRAHYVP